MPKSAAIITPNLDICQKPKHPPNSCFIYAEIGHFLQNSSKKTLSAAMTEVGENKVLDVFNMVSVAFVKQDKRH